MPIDGAPGETIRLRDGRLLAFTERGNRDGWPVIHCHANPAGRLEAWGGEARPAAHGVRLITCDRPGIGASDPKKGRTVADWADDVAELADGLGIDRFAVTGLSLGGPHAAACAWKLPDRVTAVALVSAIARIDQPGFLAGVGVARFLKLAKRAPWMMAFIYATVVRRARRAPDGAHELFWRNSTRVDRAVVDRPEVSARFLRVLDAAATPSARGLVEDMRTAQRPWGFDPGNIQVPVYLWHGGRDRVVPPPHAQYWIDAVPDCRPVWYEGEGHFLIEDHIDEILESVAR